jgi:hypothetical protein
MSRIRCTSGGEPHHHESVAEVRSCVQSQRKPTESMLNEVRRLRGDLVKAAAMSFDECFTYVANLRKGTGGLGGMTVAQPQKTGGLQHLKWGADMIMQVPEGYFAMAKPDGQSYEFWRVGVQVEGEGDDKKIVSWRLQSVPKRARHSQLKLREVLLIDNRGVKPWASIVEPMADHINSVLKKIFIEGPKMQIIYGRQEGYCGVCGKELSDPQSTALGIGPVCLRDNPHYLETIADLDDAEE